MNVRKKKLLETVKVKKDLAENNKINKTIPPKNVLSLEQIELRTRKITDEFNGVVAFLCKELAKLYEENENIKKQINENPDAPEE